MWLSPLRVSSVGHLLIHVIPDPDRPLCQEHGGGIEPRLEDLHHPLPRFQVEGFGDAREIALI